MRLRTKDGDYFDVPDKLVPDIERTSPVWADYGSATVPVKLPRTTTNLQLCGWLNPHDNKGSRKIPVIAELGGVEYSGVMDVIDSDLSVVVGFDESETYDKLDDLKLKDIPGLPKVEYAMDVLLDRLDRVYRNNITDTDYKVFPVLLKIEEHQSIKYYHIMNRPLQVDGSLEGMKRFTRKALVNGTPMDVAYPQGYGIAPMLRLQVLLKLAIEKGLGYQLVSNDLSGDDMDNLCVMHNTIDMCCLSYIDYKDMMPDATIGDLLDMIRARFGAFVFFDSQTMTARIVLAQTLFNDLTLSAVDLTDKVASKLKESYSNYKHLVIKEKRNDSNETLTDTYEDFCAKKYHMYNACSEVDIFDTTSPQADCKLRKSTGVFYGYNKDANKYDQISSPAFDYDKKETKLDKYDLKPNSTLIVTYKGYKADYYDGITMPYYKSEPQHATTSYENKEQNKDESSDRYLALAYYMGMSRHNNHPYGSTRAMDDMGINLHPQRSTNLENWGTNGLFKRYLAKWDAVLRHAGQKTELKMNLNQVDIEHLRPDTKIVIDNVVYLYESIKLKHNQLADVILRRISLQPPYDLAVDQLVPDISEQRYIWEVYTNLYYDIADLKKVLTTELATEHGVAESNIEVIGRDAIDPVTSPFKDEFEGIRPPIGPTDKITRQYVSRYSITFQVTNGANVTNVVKQGEMKYTGGVIASI